MLSERAALKRQFDLLPDAEQHAWNRRAAAKYLHEQGRAAAAPRLPRADAPVAQQSRAVCGLSGDGLPVNEQAFLTAAGCDVDDAFRAWGPAARAEFQEATFVEDGGRIPRATRISLPRACWQRHPGVCMHKDRAIYDSIYASGVALADDVWKHKRQFEWMKLELTAENNPEATHCSEYFWCAYARGANPKLTLFLAGHRGTNAPVSYTHLTLPTILLV
eukprot:9476396-Pyramimonas_sp.AAC.1